MASFSIEAVILTRKEVGEADRLLTIFSRSMGKMRVIAKGVRRTTSRMAPHLEPGRQSKMLLVERRAWPLVTQAETITNFIPQDQSLAELQDIMQMLEIVHVLLDDGQRESRLYDVLVQMLSKQKNIASHAMDGLSESEYQPMRQLITGIFAIKALSLLGYRMEVQRCSICHEQISPMPKAAATQPQSQIFFDVARGGLTHAHGKPTGAGVFSLDASAVDFLQHLHQGTLTKLPTLSADLTQQLVRPVYAFIEWHADKRLKSATVLA